MANPNIVSVNSIYGNVTGYALTTTLTNVLVANGTGSNTIYKIDLVQIANVTSAAANVTIQLHTAANGTAGTSYSLANVISVPSSATLQVTNKNNYFYLMENQSIIGGASANSALQAVISYEAIS
jgi:hypothetical protein